MTLRAFYFLLIFGSSSIIALGQKINNAATFREWIYADSTSYRWSDDQAIARTKTIAHKLFQSDPYDKYAPGLVSYLFFSLNRQKLSDLKIETVDSARQFLEQYDESFKEKWPLYYLTMANSYNYLELMYRRLGEFEHARKMIDMNEMFLTTAINTDREGEYCKRAMRNLVGAFINRGSLLYFATHHLDSEERRKEIGPKVAKYFSRADSVIEVYDSKYGTSEDIPAKSRLTLALNQYLLYGAYYVDSIQATTYRNKVAGLLETHCQNNGDQYCQNSFNALTTTAGLIALSTEKYRKCIDIMRPFYFNLMEERKRPGLGLYFPVQDAAFSLTKSYYHLGQPDSVKYFGSLYLSDSTELKDYFAMSEIASILSEVYLTTDVQQSKDLLKLSKKCIANSQNSLVKGKLIKEGEIIQLNRSFQRILNVSEQLRLRQQDNVKNILLGLLVILILSAAAIAWLLRKLTGLKASKLSPKQ